MGEIRVRKAVVEDADRIGQIAVDAWQFAYSGFVPADFMAARCDPAKRAQRTRERWSATDLRLVALSDSGDVIGFAFEEHPCTLKGYDSEIGALYVDPKFSRAGAGKALVVEMVRRFVDRDARSLAIHTLTENKIGCAFYQKLGGQEGPYTTWNDIPSRWFVWPNLMELLHQA